MKNIKPQGKFVNYILRFSVIHTISYFLVAIIFVAFQNALPDADSIGLNLYQPFRALDTINILGQLLRGLAFGFVFYPFYHIVFNRKGGRLLLFLSMWAVGLFCSVEPQPGSIEGIIYTVITFAEHASVLIAVGIQMLLFVWLIFWIENRFAENNLLEIGVQFSLNQKNLKGYIIRFTLVHLFTYWVVGGIFYELTGYNDALETMEIFNLWRPMESLNTVLLVFFGQIFRGTLLAVLLYPFYKIYIDKKSGWAQLYLLMIGLTILGSPLFLTEFIDFNGSIAEFIKSLAVGIPEIFSQMLMFSLIFFFWQRRSENKRMKIVHSNMCIFLT
jgi:hypothetical protein